MPYCCYPIVHRDSSSSSGLAHLSYIQQRLSNFVPLELELLATVRRQSMGCPIWRSRWSRTAWESSAANTCKGEAELKVELGCTRIGPSKFEFCISIVVECSCQVLDLDLVPQHPVCPACISEPSNHNHHSDRFSHGCCRALLASRKVLLALAPATRHMASASQHFQHVC